jgi:hypothetical protein
MHVFGSYSEMGQPSKRFGEEEGTSGITSNAGVGDARPNPREAVVHAENASGPKTIADLQKMHDQYFAAMRQPRGDDHEVHVHIG